MTNKNGLEVQLFGQREKTILRFDLINEDDDFPNAFLCALLKEGLPMYYYEPVLSSWSVIMASQEKQYPSFISWGKDPTSFDDAGGGSPTSDDVVKLVGHYWLLCQTNALHTLAYLEESFAKAHFEARSGRNKAMQNLMMRQALEMEAVCRQSEKLSDPGGQTGLVAQHVDELEALECHWKANLCYLKIRQREEHENLIREILNLTVDKNCAIVSLPKLPSSSDQTNNNQIIDPKPVSRIRTTSLFRKAASTPTSSTSSMRVRAIKETHEEHHRKATLFGPVLALFAPSSVFRSLTRHRSLKRMSTSHNKDDVMILSNSISQSFDKMKKTVMKTTVDNHLLCPEGRLLLKCLKQLQVQDATVTSHGTFRLCFARSHFSVCNLLCGDIVDVVRSGVLSKTQMMKRPQLTYNNGYPIPVRSGDETPFDDSSNVFSGDCLSGNHLSAVVVPCTEIENSILKCVMENHTELIFPDLEEQLQMIKEHGPFQPGDVFLTRHSNIKSVQVAFHLFIDKKEEIVSNRCLLGLRRIVEICHTHSISCLTLPLLLMKDSTMAAASIPYWPLQQTFQAVLRTLNSALVDIGDRAPPFMCLNLVLPATYSTANSDDGVLDVVKDTISSIKQIFPYF
eukprot:GHVL01019032.1.p1 GENE.GHVL01019032.1~~GHVL01019032.1.p1  ORF type:complete len:624 (-),score=59.16 GHVL01019032.1:1930-3801(-)